MTVFSIVIGIFGLLVMVALVWPHKAKDQDNVLENPNFIPRDHRITPRHPNPLIEIPVPTDWDEAVVAELIIAPALVPDPAVVPLTPCRICNREFKNVSQHIRMAHVCPICGKEFKRAAQHRRMTHARDTTMKENQK